MKSILYIAFFLFTTTGMYAQQSSESSIAEETKLKATKIAQELQLNDDQAVYLHRVLYSSQKSIVRAKERLNNDQQALDSTLEKIDQAKFKQLSYEFDPGVVEKIKTILKKL